VGRDQPRPADARPQLTQELDPLVAGPREDLGLSVVAGRSGRRAQRVVAAEDPDAEPPERPRDPEALVVEELRDELRDDGGRRGLDAAHASFRSSSPSSTKVASRSSTCVRTNSRSSSWSGSRRYSTLFDARNASAGASCQRSTSASVSPLAASKPRSRRPLAIHAQQSWSSSRNSPRVP